MDGITGPTGRAVLPEDDITYCSELSNMDMPIVDGGAHYDDISGEKLDAEGVARASTEDMQDVYKHHRHSNALGIQCWKMAVNT